MKAVYPVKIRYDSRDKVYYAEPVDLGERGECFTYGHDLYEALDMAEDALNLEMLDNDNPPVPSDINKLEHKPGEILTLVKVDTEEYSHELRRLKIADILRRADIANLIINTVSDALNEEKKIA